MSKQLTAQHLVSMTPELRGKMYMTLKKAILDGQIDPLDFMVKKKALEETLELVAKDKDIKDLIVSEIEKHKAEGGATRLGAKLTISSRSTYDYSADPVWASIKEEMQPLEARLKAQEEKIKSATKNGAALTDLDGGEVCAIPVPVSTTDSVTVKMPK